MKNKHASKQGPARWIKAGFGSRWKSAKLNYDLRCGTVHPLTANATRDVCAFDRDKEQCFYFQNEKKMYSVHPEKIFMDNENKQFLGWSNRCFSLKRSADEEDHSVWWGCPGVHWTQWQCFANMGLDPCCIWTSTVNRCMLMLAIQIPPRVWQRTTHTHISAQLDRKCSALSREYRSTCKASLYGQVYNYVRIQIFLVLKYTVPTQPCLQQDL